MRRGSRKIKDMKVISFLFFVIVSTILLAILGFSMWFATPWITWTVLLSILLIVVNRPLKRWKKFLLMLVWGFGLGFNPAAAISSLLAAPVLWGWWKWAVSFFN
jgi:hypothetical protein